MLLLALLLPLLASADGPDLRSLKEKTFTRDNSYCRIGDKRVEIQIRSNVEFTESRERNYGEYLFYYVDEQPGILPLNKERMHTYRLYEGGNSLCTKSLAYPIGKNKLAVLFLKENRPFKDKLAIQLFHLKNQQPADVVDTEFITDLSEKADDGFYFRTHAERNGIEMGKVKMNDLEYTYQDRNFMTWMKYNGLSFEAQPKLSFEKFEFKKYFKDEADFLKTTGWNAKEKKFANTILYVAVHLKSKKECILVADKKIKITGSENWRCN